MLTARDAASLVAFVLAAVVGCLPRLYYLTQETGWHVGYRGGGFTLADMAWIRDRLFEQLPSALELAELLMRPAELAPRVGPVRVHIQCPLQRLDHRR